MFITPGIWISDEKAGTALAILGVAAVGLAAVCGGILLARDKPEELTDIVELYNPPKTHIRVDDTPYISPVLDEANAIIDAVFGFPPGVSVSDTYLIDDPYSEFFDIAVYVFNNFTATNYAPVYLDFSIGIPRYMGLVETCAVAFNEYLKNNDFPEIQNQLAVDAIKNSGTVDLCRRYIDNHLVTNGLNVNDSGNIVYRTEDGEVEVRGKVPLRYEKTTAKALETDLSKILFQ